MGQGVIHVYSGDGHGKSSAELGKAVQAASIGKSVVIIQFLKGLADNSFIKRLEPEIKFFRFEKSDADFNLLSEAEKVEEIQNIKNGLNFAKKVLATGGCDLLILDEVLGLIDNQIISVEDLMTIINTRDEETSVIITGIQLDNELCRVADEISKIETVKYKVW